MTNPIDNYFIGKMEVRDALEEKFADPKTNEVPTIARIAAHIIVPLTPAEIIHFIARMG